MDEQRLATWESLGADWTERKVGPIVARMALVELTAEVRRLQRENHLLHLSRGSSALVGMD